MRRAIDRSVTITYVPTAAAYGRRALLFFRYTPCFNHQHEEYHHHIAFVHTPTPSRHVMRVVARSHDTRLRYATPRY